MNFEYIDPWLYYTAITLIATITSLSVAFGESFASIAAVRALNIQPGARNEITRTVIFGMALTETSAIVGLVMAFIFITARTTIGATPYAGLTSLGIVAALGITGGVVGLLSAQPIIYACSSVARQPFFAAKILNIMLITTSFIQTPVIFGFIVALLIFYQIPQVTSPAESLRLIASGLSIGLGSVGPAIGLGMFAKSVCRSIGFNRDSYNRLLTFTFVSQALVETPIILALVISFILIGQSTADYSLIKGIAALTAAGCVGIGTFAPGVGSGSTAATACSMIAEQPHLYSPLSRVSVIAQALIDATAVYAWLIALIAIITAS
jgi:F-type H+-transporting ATPase subunit c